MGAMYGNDKEDLDKEREVLVVTVIDIDILITLGEFLIAISNDYYVFINLVFTA